MEEGRSKGDCRFLERISKPRRNNGTKRGLGIGGKRRKGG